MSAGDWRAAVADALDEQADALDHALAELNTAHAVLEQLDRGRACQELRATAATLRMEITDLRSAARSLRAKPTDDGHGFSMALTTRYARRKELDP